MKIKYFVAGMISLIVFGLLLPQQYRHYLYILR